MQQTEIESDNVEMLAMKTMLRKVLSRRRLEEFSSLIAAAKDGDVDMVRTLLSRGADINMVDYDGRSALAMVCCFHCVGWAFVPYHCHLFHLIVIRHSFHLIVTFKISRPAAKAITK